MKNCTILFFLLITVTLFSCQKPCGCAPPPRGEYMYATFKKASILPWSTKLVDTIKKDTVTIIGNNNSLQLKLKFNLDITAGKAPEGYVQKKFDAAFYKFGYVEGDVVSYKLDTAANNSLKLYTYSGSSTDNGHQWVAGSFNLTFKVAKPTGDISVDTTRVYFSNGRFQAILDK
jgi:hypothetical protein